MPHVLTEAEPTIKGYNLGDRINTEAGSFFDTVTTGADTYLLSLILHDWNDAEASNILTNIRDAAAPGGCCIVALEFVMPADDEPHMSKMIDLTMLGMLDGRERTDAEMRTLFENAGLAYQGVVETPTPISIVEAQVP
ncbi:MAG: methyltransferase [Actinomycetota bacterium]